MQTQASDFWNDPQQAEIKLREIAGIKSWTTAYEHVKTSVEDLVVLQEFLAEGEAEI